LQPIPSFNPGLQLEQRQSDKNTSCLLLTIPELGSAAYRHLREIQEGYSLRVIIFALAALVSVHEANGATVLASVRGNDLYPHCTIEDPACMAYVTGVADTLEMVAPHLTNICRPSASTMAQVFDIAMAWLADNPVERHRPAAKLVGLALAEAWPCNR